MRWVRHACPKFLNACVRDCPSRLGSASEIQCCPRLGGDVRWVRPGFDYGPEYNYGEPMQITVRPSCPLTLPMG